MTLARIDLLELDIDQRIADLRAEMFRMPDRRWTPKEVAVFMRAAYGQGYMDALKDKGELCVNNGYGLPPT